MVDLEPNPGNTGHETEPLDGMQYIAGYHCRASYKQRMQSAYLHVFRGGKKTVNAGEFSMGTVRTYTSPHRQ